jgi:hypothetical protein
MRGKKTSFVPLFIVTIGLGLLSACSNGAPERQNDTDKTTSQGGEASRSGTGLRTSTPAPEEVADAGDTDPGRWVNVTSFRGTFTFTLERDIEETDPVMGWLQTIRSSRSATGTIGLHRLDEDTWSGEGTMVWLVDDFIEVRDENGELIRSATAVGDGETTLDLEETLLWIDLELGTYGLAIYPSGLYDTMEVDGTEIIVGAETKDEKGPLGYLGLMDTAGIAGWFEDLSLPEAGLTLGGNLVLPDESVMTWVLEAEQ